MRDTRRHPLADQSVGKLVKRAEQAMLKAKGAALKRVGLTLAQYVALIELKREEGVTSATLARACFVSPQAMMVVLKGMEQQGLIARSANPRHPNIGELHITTEGRKVLSMARTRMDPIEQSVLDAFPPREMAAFRTFLIRFIDAFEGRKSAC
jgi:DNA-binding MarR family transcriptional regulator